MNENKELTLREILLEINTELEAIFNKSVIHMNYYNKYDTENGRRIITLYDVLDKIQGYTNTRLFLTYNKHDIVLYGSDFVIKTKRKKSGMRSSWNSKERYTIVKVSVDEKFLDRTLAEVYEEHKTKRQTKEQEEDIYNEIQKTNFINKLNGINLSFDAFVDLLKEYNNLSHKTKESIQSKDE
jgi:hypothetical protein